MIDTISLSLPPRPGEQILGRPHPQLLAVQATRLIEPGELEPYRALLTEFNLSRGNDAVGAERVTVSMIELPFVWFVTLPQFFRWMRDNHKVHPGHETSEPEVTTFHVGDRVRYVEHEGNVSLVGDVRVVLAVRDGEVELVHADGPLAGDFANGGVTFDRLALVSCPHVTVEAEQQPEPVVTVGQSSFHIGDRLRYTDGALLGLEVITVEPPAVHHARDEGVFFRAADNQPDGIVVPSWLPTSPSAWDRVQVFELVSCPHAETTVPQGNRVSARQEDGSYLFEGVPVPITLTHGDGSGNRGYHAPIADLTAFGAALPDGALVGHRAEIDEWTRSSNEVRRNVPGFIADPMTAEFDNGRYLGGFINWWTQRQDELAAAEPIVPQGNGNDGAEWGPNHPEWAGWWERARTLAERFGYGSQYDALAEQLGGPERVTYDMVTVTIQFPLEQDRSVTRDLVRTAVDTHGFAITDRHQR